MFIALKNLLIVISNALLQFLPDSPFKAFIDSFQLIPSLGYMNYFLPVTEMLAIGQAWVACIAIYYLYQGVMRLVKMID